MAHYFKSSSSKFIRPPAVLHRLSGRQPPLPGTGSSLFPGAAGLNSDSSHCLKILFSAELNLPLFSLRKLPPLRFLFCKWATEGTGGLLTIISKAPQREESLHFEGKIAHLLGTELN